jgi:hypothetical protein
MARLQQSSHSYFGMVSTMNIPVASKLGLADVIDYTTASFEDVVGV